MQKIKLEPLKTISGLRGIIENKENDSLTFEEIEKIIKSFISLLNLQDQNKTIIIGRDGRKSGEKITKWIQDILIEYGINILDIEYSTTPTLALASKDSGGGIMITASHNPEQWNGIKLFVNGTGFSKELWNKIFNNPSPTLSISLNKGKYIKEDFRKYIQNHIDKILKLEIINIKSIKEKKWKIAIDGTNSTGSIAIKMLLENLGIKEIKNINSEINGTFNRNPEPIPENLNEISEFIKNNDYNIGFATDPDADRLAIIDEKGIPWGEEYTLIACSDYILQKKSGTTVSNLSSSRLLKDITEKYDCKYYPSLVGESNVIAKMKEVNAIIGGEGNGGVIYSELNYCRDSLIGVALILSYLSEFKLSASELKNKYPQTYFIKKKINLDSNINIDSIINSLKTKYKEYQINLDDGIRIDFEDSWIHIRKSNTEHILRICGEGNDKKDLNILINKIEFDIKQLII